MRGRVEALWLKFLRDSTRRCGEISWLDDQIDKMYLKILNSPDYN